MRCKKCGENNQLLKMFSNALVVADAIENELGVTFAQIRGKDRHRRIALARTLFCSLLPDIHPSDLGVIIGRDRVTIIHHLQSGEDRLKTDREFIRAHKKVLNYYKQNVGEID